MSSYLDTLAALALGQARRIEPRLPSLFEPIGDDDAVWTEEVDERAPTASEFRGPGEDRPGPTQPEVSLQLDTADSPGRPTAPARATAPPVRPGAIPAEPPPAPAAVRAVEVQPARPGTGRPQVQVTVRAGSATPPEPPETPAAELPGPSAPLPPVPPGPTRPAGTPTPAHLARPAVAPAPAALPSDRLERAPVQPAVRVHIGRVEVRAVLPPAPAPPLAVPEPLSSAPDLQDYLDGAIGRSSR